jgi:hypothetical protein
MRKLILLAMVVALVGCAAPKQHLNTASGNPEVIIEGVNRKQVADRIVDRLTGKGLTIHQVTEYKIVAGQKAEDFGAKFFFGSRYDGIPEYRITYTLVDQPPAAVKVYGRAGIVTNPGSAFERVRDMTDGQKQNLQDMLGKLRSEFEPTKPSIGSAAAASPTTSPTPTTAAAPGGTETYQAERLARDQSCNATPRAALLAKGAGFESYSVPCSNGDALTIRCEFGTCRVLR